MNAADAPRSSCPMCVLKHLGQAAILFQESLQGYPHHRWLAIGHLAEAEAESQEMAPQFADIIRSERKKAEDGTYVPNCTELLARFENGGSQMASQENMADRIAEKFEGSTEMTAEDAVRELLAAAKEITSAIRVAKVLSGWEVIHTGVEGGNPYGMVADKRQIYPDVKEIAKISKARIPMVESALSKKAGEYSLDVKVARHDGGSRKEGGYYPKLKISFIPRKYTDSDITSIIKSIM